MDKRDLVVRLLSDAQGEDLGADGMGWSPDPALLREAADELKRLRDETAALKREAHTWWTACAHATKEIEWLTQEVRRFRADADKWQAKAEALGLAIATVAKSDGA